MDIQKKIQKLELISGKFKKKLNIIQNYRLFIGLLAALSLVCAATNTLPKVSFWSFLVVSAIFYFLKVISSNYTMYIKKINNLKNFYTRQIKRKKGAFFDKENKFQLSAEESQSSSDLQLNGKKGLLNQIDESFSLQGAHTLFKKMFIENSNQKIIESQNCVKDLKKIHWPLTKWLIKNKESEKVDFSLILPLFQSKDSINLNKTLVILTVFIYILSIALIFTSKKLAPYTIVTYILLTLSQLGPVHAAYGKALGMGKYFKQFLNAVFDIETNLSSNKWVQNICPTITKHSPSRDLSSLNKSITMLSVHNHPLVCFFINAIFPYSFYHHYKLTKKMDIISEKITPFFDEIAQLESFASLTLLYKYQTSIFPNIIENKSLEVINGFHPLVDSDLRVANSFQLGEANKIALITGSNMSGKSTFLRTIGINQILANMGAPVFAESMTTEYRKIMTCIHIVDSLQDGISYFYAEVIRIKQILKESAKDKKILFFIDELFRGTNNKERTVGSYSVLSQLSANDSLGLLTTHDLQLTSLSENIPSIKNFHFKEDIKDEKMNFSYKIKEGPCTSTNAIFIMKNEGITITEPPLV